jgi:hypothetical protein
VSWLVWGCLPMGEYVMRSLRSFVMVLLALLILYRATEAAPKAADTTCEMSCLVLDAYSGLPVEGARVLVYWQTPPNGCFGERYTDCDGHATFTVYKDWSLTWVVFDDSGFYQSPEYIYPWRDSNGLLIVYMVRE